MTGPIRGKDASRTPQETLGVESTNLDQLPTETLIEITKYLPLNGLSRLSQQSSRFNHIANQELRERSGVRLKVYTLKDEEEDSPIDERYHKEQDFRDRETPDNKNLHDLWSRATKAFKNNPHFQQFKDRALSPETTRSYSYNYVEILKILLKKPKDMTLQDLIAARLCTQDIKGKIYLSEEKKSFIHKSLLKLPTLDRQIQFDDYLRMPDQPRIKFNRIYENDPSFKKFYLEIFSLKTQQDYNYGKILEIWLREPRDITLQDLVVIGLCTQEVMESIKNKRLFSHQKKYFTRDHLLNFFTHEKQPVQLNDFLLIPNAILDKALITYKNDPLLRQFFSEIFSLKTQQDYNYGKILEIWLREPQVITPQDLVDIGFCTQKERMEMKLDEKLSDTKKSFIRDNLLRLFIPNREIQLKEFLEIPDHYIEGGLVATYARSKNLDHPVKITEKNPGQAQAVLQNMFTSGMFIHTEKDLDQMHWAVEKGELALLEKLIKHDAIIDQRNHRNLNALQIAAGYSEVKIVKNKSLIMIKGLIKDMRYSQMYSSIREKDSSGNDALDYALKYGEGEAVELLFKALKPDHQYKMILKKNVLCRDDDLSYLKNQTVRRLFNALTLEHQYELLAEGENTEGYPFLSAMVINDPEIAENLIKPLASSAQIYKLLNRQDDHGLTTFGHAIQQQNFELIKCFMGKLTHRAQKKLLAQKAAKGKTAMELAAKCGNKEILNYFKQISPPLPTKLFNYLKEASKLNLSSGSTRTRKGDR